MDNEERINEDRKFVTLEMFEKYHEQIMDYIRIHDDLILNGESTCSKCGSVMTSDKCENCSRED